jgi:transposase
MSLGKRSAYQTDVTDEEWAFVVPYLALCREDALQRDSPLREVFNGLRYIVKTGNQWRLMPDDLPPWYVVYQQMRRWVAERSCAWAARFRRLARDYERFAETLAALHYLAFAILIRSNLARPKLITAAKFICIPFQIQACPVERGRPLVLFAGLLQGLNCAAAQTNRAQPTSHPTIKRTRQCP